MEDVTTVYLNRQLPDSGMGKLEECRSIAVEMQRYRASSYRLLEQISQESNDEEYRD